MSGSGSMHNDLLVTEGDSNNIHIRTVTPDQSIDPGSQTNNYVSNQDENYDL
jgi:hypothetical protein